MKAWELPVAKNPLRDREDLIRSLGQILSPLEGRFVRGGAGLHIGNSAAHYDEAAALMEGELRLLWGLAPLAAGGGDSPFFERLRAGIAAGTDPGGPGYWGRGGERDQRFVEMAAIAFALLLAPGTFWDPLAPAAKAKLAAWLGTINSAELPPSNWECFRVTVNLALRRLGLDYGKDRLASALELLDGLYRQDGWYVDETNFDLYNPDAFHFFGLLYAVFAEKEDPGRCRLYRERARLFLGQYLPWFSSDGSCLPFGRSLGYRFASSSFFSALAFAGEPGPGWGALKGIVLRSLRHWLRLPIFDHEGVLSIGYAYPDLLVAEQYNSPGSPYWALKAYLLLALPDSHPFWRAEEEDLPEMPRRVRLGPPHLLIERTGEKEGEHAYALNAGQYPCYESENAAAKYAKFAYSQRFGFCVSHSSYDLPKLGCDSSLLLSEGDGYWRERRGGEERFSCDAYVSSLWRPWRDVEIKTWLLPFGPWHLRLHRIRSSRALHAVEGGFSLPLDLGLDVPPLPQVDAGAGSLLARFPWASGGVKSIFILGAAGIRFAELHKPEPNLNLLFPRVLIPVLRGRIEPGLSLLCCAVFAEPGPPRDAEWLDPPTAAYDPVSGAVEAGRGGIQVRIETGCRGLAGA